VRCCCQLYKDDDTVGKMNAEVVLLVLDSQTAAFQDTTAFHVSVRAVARWVPPQLRSRGFRLSTLVFLQNLLQNRIFHPPYPNSLL
jgi:hypothetical protein